MHADQSAHSSLKIAIYSEMYHGVGTCTSWRQTLLGNQSWWHAWYDRQWSNHKTLLGSGNIEEGDNDWQQLALTKGLHIPWRYKPVISKRLLYCMGRQVSVLPPQPLELHKPMQLL